MRAIPVDGTLVVELNHDDAAALLQLLERYRPAHAINPLWFALGEFVDGDTQQYVTVADAATELGVSQYHVRRLCRTGKLGAIRVDGEWLIDPESVALRAEDTFATA